MEAGKLTHSQSQPGGMDRTPPGTPKKGGKMLAVRVQMLDDTITMFQVQAKALGRVLFDQVCSQLHLLESDYFGLEYQEVGGTKYWLDLEKPLSRQIGLSLVDTLVKFCVKFYTPDPSQLEEEFTRYLFCLQIKRDLSQGLLQCNNNTAALMASYIVQAECGDYVAEDYPDYRYLSSYKFVPNQDQELEKRIMENHKKHAGQSPAEADLNLLETARRCELYGIKMHPAKDHEGVPLNLAVAHMGIVVFQNFTKINTFSWAKIRKISFKRKRFLVKLHPEGYGYYKDTVEFFFEGRNECKNFWKKCVENHGFFRCTTVKKVPRQKTRVLSRGSSFRYSGRTQKQIVDFVRENYVKRQTFQRSQSFRHSSSAHSSVANVGTSISAHPLLPLGENAVAGTPASLSCGSMTLTSSPIHAADVHVGGLPSPPAITSVSPGTSVTSSPQHFYPQENHYPRAGHQRAKVTHPHDHSHHGISPHPGSTNAATPASTHSANHSNNNINNAVIDDGDDDENDAKTSRLASDYANFNDVYSNCYSSLRSLHNNLESSDFNHNKTKIDVETDLNGHSFLNGTSKSNESITSAVKPCKSLVSNKTRRNDEIDWNRSTSYKDLYREENLTIDSESAKNLKAKSKSGYENVSTYKYDLDSIPNRLNGTRLKNYSIVSKYSGRDRNGGAVADLSIYSKTYPGTASSLSTESAEEEPEDPLVEVFDVKYDSQEEMVLSHDDISHDSYELLERDPGDFDDEAHRGKNRRNGGDSDRARSCSWGSDRGMSPLNFRSTENVLIMSETKSRENGFWSLERERSPKHKSEGDFRSLDRKNSRGFKSCAKEDVHRSMTPVNNKRGKQKDWGMDDLDTSPNRENVFDVLTKINQVDTEMILSKELAEKEYLRLLEREPWVCSQRGGYDQDRPPERAKYQVRKKSLEKCEPFLMKVEPEDKFTKEKQYRLEEKRRLERRREKKEERFHEGIKEKEQREWEKEKERRQLERKRNLEEKLRNEEESDNRTSTWSVKDYSDFKEIHPKKFDRVVSNQFGKYSEFLTHEKKYDLLLHERKVMENYEKVCQVGKIAKELEMKEKNNIQDSMATKNFEHTFHRDGNVLKLEDNVKDYASSAFSPVQQDSEKSSVEDFNYATIPPPLPCKAAVERTKSDPFSIRGNLRRNVLMHQKSIDLTPQHSEEKVSDQYSQDKKLKKTSRSEHDIPYILHKRLMNGSPEHFDLTAPKTETKPLTLTKPKMSDETNSSEDEDPLYEIIEPKKANFQSPTTVEMIKVPPKIINLDEKTDKLSKNITCVKMGSQPLLSKPPIGKKHPIPENKINTRVIPPKESRKVESPSPAKSKECSSPKTPVKQIKEVKEIIKIEKPVSKVSTKREEPIYAEVYRGKVVEKGEDKLKSTPPPHPPERTTSIQNKFIQENKRFEPEKKFVNMTSKVTNAGVIESVGKGPSESFKRPTPQKFANVSPKKDHEPLKPTSSTSSKEENSEELIKPQPVSVRGVTGSRRKESLILFARTRLGLSEGSAFTPVRSKGSPGSQRRTKSLDAPYVSLNRLPPADAFSSKDDTVDGNDNDVLPPVERVVEIMKKTSIPDQTDENTSKETSEAEVLESIDAEVAAHFPEKYEIQTNIKKWTEGHSLVNLAFTEEKVLDSVRSKRLLSKIESVDAVDSEGDLDSSKLTDALPIPSDRIVNLPESVRFPSVRQISGQTSEESADGWDQREVKVKRRTPRRSVGRDEPEVGLKESVVWDSKDEEIPDDDVWDDNLVFPEKFEGSLPVPDAVIPVEYLKRGSCGQSIDDDNLSTPMKESSPEHWVSVDDLPEAIEREERMLRQQEKILREKILNEKLKRELNLDTIDVDEKMYEYKVTCRQIHEEEVIDFKGKFKGHSLDTYELTEKRLREKATSKYCSLDEHILKENPIKNYVTITSTFDDSDPHSSESMDTFPNQRNIEYIKCKVVNDLREIDSFSVDNDEELEEFFVVLDEKSENERDIKNIWENENELVRTNSKDESVISVPEEFRDDDDLINAVPSNKPDFVRESELKLDEEQTLLMVSNVEDEADDADKLYRILEGGTGIMISSQEGSRHSSFDTKMLPIMDDAGRLSPRRNSNDPRRLSASDEPDRLSPLNDSRIGGDDSRRLSSEDSRKYSMSESVSEETRRRLSSTEETRRKRASLTKQCSIGADSLTDEMVSGVPEGNSSFEHDDEKDVFEAETPVMKPKEVSDECKPKSETEGHKEVLQSTATDKNDIAEKTRKNLQLQSISSNAPVSKECVPDKACEKEIAKESERVPLRNTASLPDNSHRKIAKAVSHVKSPSIPFPQMTEKDYSISTCKSSFDSSQDSDIDKLSEVSIICHVQNQISRRNLSEAGKYLKSDVVGNLKGILCKLEMEKGNLSSTDGSVCRTSSEERGLNFGQRHSSEELEKTESSSFEGKPSPDECGKAVDDKKIGSQSHAEGERTKRDGRLLIVKEKRAVEDKRDSGEDGSSSSSAPPHPKRELSSTWKPFLLESSGSSSLEENWLPPDDNAHLADEEETSSTSNNPQDESGQEDLDYPTGIGYPVVNASSAEMIVGGYGGVYALSRTLSRISERSTSEQERSDMEDDFTKPSSHSVSAEEESMLSSDRQPSLSSDPPSLRENSIGVSENSVDVIDNYNILSSTPLQNGKANGEVTSGDGKSLRSGSGTPLVRYHNNVNFPSDVTDLNHSETLSLNNRSDSKLGPSDSFSTHNNNSFDVKANLGNIRSDSIDGSVGGTELEVKKKRYNADKGYFMIKELLSTERTYKKNLDVINKWFHEEVSKAEDDMPDDVLNGLFNLFDPLNAAHSQFLRDLEQRLATWEGKSTLLHKREIQKVGDVILLHFNILPLYVKYLDKHLLVLERLDAAFRKNKKFEQVYRDFELQRVCYLPLSSFVMKPLQKLLHYHCLLKRMINHYGPEHLEHKDFSMALKKLEPIVENIPSILKVSENFVQLSELQRDMPSFEGLLQGGREFIRQGCLMKHSKKGFQQRMFFLFSDILVYTNRCTSPILQFKVNGQMPLRGVMIEESDDKIGTNFSFTIYGGNRTLVVAASSQDEKDKWLKDLYEAVQNARERNDGKTLQYLSLKSCSSSDEIMDAIGDDAATNKSKNSQQRSNTTVHVCWHRNTSTSLRDHLRSYENELSGFLLRKFKNSNGWQKLWVVFANFCLFFYKAYLDESPLASLPLLGYTVTVPDEEDDIRKDYVFKLQFKNHVYFFRAESDYTFSRWMEIISSATKKSKELTTLEEGKDNS